MSIIEKRYFFDTEFVEGFRRPLFEKRRHFIDLISIGMVCDDGREFYMICKEFDLDYAWADPWLRRNVLEKIHAELCSKQSIYAKTFHYKTFEPFTKKSMRNLLRWHGYTRDQITAHIYEFLELQYDDFHGYYLPNDLLLKFYAYYADYDWVVLCGLFGRMVNLPSGLPKFCHDLKQIQEQFNLSDEWKNAYAKKSENEHNALADAKWNKHFFDEMVRYRKIMPPITCNCLY